MYQYVAKDALPLSLYSLLIWCSRTAIPTKLFEGDWENDKASISTDKETDEGGPGLERTWSELPSPLPPIERKYEYDGSSSPCRQENGDHDPHHVNVDSQSVTSTVSLPTGKSKQPVKEKRGRAETK